LRGYFYFPYPTLSISIHCSDTSVVLLLLGSAALVVVVGVLVLVKRQEREEEEDKKNFGGKRLRGGSLPKTRAWREVDY
jgi:hypothetical protein